MRDKLKRFEGERIILTARSGWRSYILPACMLALYGFWIYGALQTEGVDRLVHLIALIAVGVELVRFCALRLKAFLVLTDQRVYGETGFLVIRTMEVPLDKVGGVYVEQNPLGRLTGRGTVAISTSGSLFEFDHIPDAIHVRDALMEQVDRVQSELSKQRDADAAHAAARVRGMSHRRLRG